MLKILEFCFWIYFILRATNGASHHEMSPSVALGSIVVIAMYSVYVLKIDPPTTFKIFPKIDLLMSCSLCPQSLGHENISF